MSSSEKRLHSMAAELEAVKVGAWSCHACTCNCSTAATSCSYAQAVLSAAQQSDPAPSVPDPWARRAL